MRVLILTPDIYTRGGIARYTATLASALGDLIGPADVHVLPLLGVRAEEDSSQYRVLPPVAARLSAVAKFRFASRALGLGLRRYDLVAATHVGLSPVAGIIRSLFGTPFWITCHGSEAWGRFPVDVRWAAGRAELLLPVSRFTADRLEKVNGIPQSRMRVLYNAIPDAFAARLMGSNGINGPTAASGRKEKRILSVGTVSRETAYKGYDTVIRALPQVLRAIPNARYVVAGDGDDIGRLKHLACETGVQNHVEFKGGVTDAGLAACYRDCDVFTLPSRTALMNGNGWQGEGFGRVYVEAALAGKPVVGSIGGGAAEAVLNEETGLLVDPASVSEVAGGLIRLLRDPGLAGRMGEEGRRWALKNFTSGAMRWRLAELLKASGCSAQSEVAEGSASRLALDAPKDIPQLSGGIRWP